LRSLLEKCDSNKKRYPTVFSDVKGKISHSPWDYWINR